MTDKVIYTEEKDDCTIESDIRNLLKNEEDDFEELDEYLEKYEDSYSDDIYEFAFREAIRLGNKEYVDIHADDFELNDDDGCSSYIHETNDEKIIDILMEHGAFKSFDDYEGYRFAIETVNWTIISFDDDFRQEVFDKYLETFGLTEEKVIKMLSSDEDGDDEDFDEEEFDRDIEADMETLGVHVEDGCLEFDFICGDENYDIKDLIEELGWDCEFEGDSWKLETVGTYFIK